jgi:hypothetical protein
MFGKKTLPLPEQIASALIYFTTKEGALSRFIPITVHGITLNFIDGYFVINYKKNEFCVSLEDVIELIKTYKKLGLPLPDQSKKQTFKKSVQKTVSQGLENLGYKNPSTFKRYSRPNTGATISQGLENLGLKKPNVGKKIKSGLEKLGLRKKK